jgi:hypothetical protein
VADSLFVLLQSEKLVIHGYDRRLEHAQIANRFSKSESGPPTLCFRGWAAVKPAAPAVLINILNICSQRNVLLQDIVIASLFEQPSVALLGQVLQQNTCVNLLETVGNSLNGRNIRVINRILKVNDNRGRPHGYVIDKVPGQREKDGALVMTVFDVALFFVDNHALHGNISLDTSTTIPGVHVGPEDSCHNNHYCQVGKDGSNQSK